MRKLAHNPLISLLWRRAGDGLLARRDFAELMHAFPGHVPIFLPDDYTTHLRRLKQEHSAELSALLKPLEQLSLSERDAVGAAGIARAAALAWEANEDVIAALLPREVPRTLALPAPGIADWMLPEPPDHGVGMYDSVPQAVKHASIHVSHVPELALGCRVSDRAQPTTGPSSTVCDSGREPLYSYGRRRSYWPTWRATGVPTARRCADEKSRSSYPKPSSSPGPGLDAPLRRTQARAKTHRPVLHALRQARSPNPNPSPSPSPSPSPKPSP